MDDLKVVALEDSRGRAERVRRGAEHQRQGRTKLVADVAEEQRLGAVELRHGRGPKSLLLRGPRARDRRGELRGDEREESEVSLGRGTPRSEAEDDEAVPISFVSAQWDDDGPLGPDAVAPARQGNEAAREVVDGDGLTGAQRLVERPPLGGSAQVGAPREGRRARGSERRPAVVSEEVHEGEGNVRVGAFEDRGAEEAGLRRGPRDAGSFGERAQRLQLSLALNLFGGLLDREQDAADLAVVVGHGALRERVERLLREAAAVDEEQLVLAPQRGATRQNALHQRADDIPDLRPDHAHRSTERCGVLDAQRGDVGVVVELEGRSRPQLSTREAAAQA